MAMAIFGLIGHWRGCTYRGPQEIRQRTFRHVKLYEIIQGPDQQLLDG